MPVLVRVRYFIVGAAAVVIVIVIVVFRPCLAADWPDEKLAVHKKLYELYKLKRTLVRIVLIKEDINLNNLWVQFK